MFSELSGLQMLFIIGSIVLSMGIHEAMHAFSAHALGDATAKDMGRLTLNPFKHIDIYTTLLLPMVLILLGVQPFFAAKPVPFNPYNVRFNEYGAALIGIAGPLTNFALAAVAAILVRLTGIAIGTVPYDAITIFIQVNLGFFVFNMIPFPPLDGSRLLYAFAPERLQEVMYRIESAGFTTIIFFMILLFPLIGPVYSNIVSGLYQFLLG